MRLALTVLAADSGARADVLLSVDDDATVGDVADALSDALAPRIASGSDVGYPRADYPTDYPGDYPGDPTGAAVGPAQDSGQGGDRLAVVLQHPHAARARTVTPDLDPSGFPGMYPPGSSTLWVDGHPLDTAAPATRVLRDGAVVSLGARTAAATNLAEPRGVAEIRVSGGPVSGTVHRLALGAVLAGSDPSCALVLDDPSVPAQAATVVVGPLETRIVPHAPGLLLEGEQLEAETVWPVGAVVTVGETLLTLHAPEEPDASLTPTEDGGLAYNRPPRIWPPQRDLTLYVPQPPEKREGPRLQMIAMFVPVIGAVGLAIAFQQPYFLAMAFLSPLMLLGNWISEKRYGKKKNRTLQKEYAEAKEKHEADLERLRFHNQTERRHNHPDPATTLLVATGPRGRLWERRIDDPDTMQLRLGTADLPAAITLVDKSIQDGDERPPPPTVWSVPVTVAFRRVGVLGLSGDRTSSRGLARWLVGQAGVHHSPRDLSIVVLAPGVEAAGAWEWVRWLPHTVPQDGQNCVTLVGTDQDTVSRRVVELVNEVTARKRHLESQASSIGAGRDVIVGRTILVVLDGARALRRIPGMPVVLSDGPAVGVYAICLDDDPRFLPEECRVVTSWDYDVPTRLRLRGESLELLGPVRADQVAPAWCERVARSLSPVRDVSRDDADAAVPDAARLLDLLQMPDPTPEQIIGFWQRLGRTTSVPIGYSAEGIHEVDIRKDGPHALVAGTTGSGKSELLQTWIAALAVCNLPESLTFVLIDYKGGAAFKDCARLPHTVGVVTDLDGHLTQRALDSLNAELKHREHVITGDGGAKDIEDYWDERRNRPELPPVPRLLLIIDEFAALAAELPDFIDGLVDIARRGRSLGVHLVLATQRPAGVVTADIRANSPLRIALRVTDGTDSSDVIESPDAATISKSHPGRCYVRAGGASGPLTLVQSARVGGRRPGAVAKTGPGVARLGWSELARPAPSLRPKEEDDDQLGTDLSVLVDTIVAANDQLGLAPQRKPWLPPLAAKVVLDELETDQAAVGQEDADLPPIPFGLSDVPSDQARAPFVLDLAGGGHLVIAGSPRTGRSAALRTLAGSIAEHVSPADVNLYVIDCGSNAMLPLVSLPHCGAVVPRDQVERVDRLLRRLTAELSRRQQLLASSGTSSLAEQRATASPEERLPYMVLLLDRWEGFTAAFENYDMGRLIEQALRLFREGASVGLRVVMTADRSGLVGQISTVFEDRLVLRFADPQDAQLAGIPAKEIPTSMPPGRGLYPTQDSILESQIALLDEDDRGPAQVAALQEIARKATERHRSIPRGQRPLRVDALPMRVTADEAMRLDPEFSPSGPLWALLGAGGDELGPLGVDLIANSPGFVVAGPPRSGRSTTLVTMVKSLTSRGTPVVLITPRRSPLRNLATHDGVLGVLGGDDDPSQMEELIGDRSSYVVVADDAELLLDARIGDAMEEVVRKARDGDHAVLAAGAADVLGSQYRGFVVETRRSRAGMLLSPTPNDGDLFGVRLPRNMDAGPLGRGLLIMSGAITPIQAALPD